MANVEESVRAYRAYKETVEKYRYALFVMSYDQVTDCPKKDRRHSAEVQDFFQKKILEIETGEDYLRLVDTLYEHRDELTDDVLKGDVELEYKGLAKLRRIPQDELYRHVENVSRAGYEWEVARTTLDYGPFLREERELLSYYKHYMRWQETDRLKGFDVILDDMEEGFTESMYDEFFAVVEQELLPFAQKIMACPKKYNRKLDTLTFDIAGQRELTRRITEAMGYTDEVGCVRETAHPFTNWANNCDVRITTSYDEKHLFSNLYSVMHETGHALFQLQMDGKYNGTNLFDGVTCATHESQSRFYENYLGRSEAFVSFLYPILQELFPVQMDGISEKDIYLYINDVRAQMKRTEADELTYPLHILIRYRVEQKLFHEEITADEISDTFNQYMEAYLGLHPADMREGCFQDIHWSSDFGYFPTYAVGSAFGAQFLRAMKADIPVDACLCRGDFGPINGWLKEHIHRYAATKRNVQLIRDVCHEEFDPHVYVQYLKEKFSDIFL